MIMWLWCIVILSFFTINNISAECNSNECTNEIDPTSINVLPVIDIDDIDEPIDLSFIHAQLLKELLLTIDFTEQTAKREFVDFYKEQSDSKDLAMILKFDLEYKKHAALWWYTYPGYIHDILNEALRAQDVISLLRMGFFIQKVHRQLEHIRETTDDITSSFMVYRGQGLSYDDYDKLKKNTSGLLSFNTFLLTNTDHEAAFSIARRAVHDGFDTAVVFSIAIEPWASVSTPFGCLDDFSYFENSENEYLFSMNTVFRIEHVEKLAGRGSILLVKLRLTNITDKRVRQLIQTTRKKIEGSTLMDQMAELMTLMKRYSTAETIYNRLLTETDENKFDRREFIHYLIGGIHEKTDNLSYALASFERSFEYAKRHREANDSTLPVIVSRIANVLKNQNKLDASLEKFQYGLSLQLQASDVNYRLLAKFYNDIGIVLNEQGKHSESLEYQEKSVAIDLEHSPNDYTNIGISYMNIAAVYKQMKNYVTTLTYFEQSLVLLQQASPINFKTVATVHYNIALLLKELNRHDEAIQNSRQAVAIVVRIYPKNDANRQACEALLEDLIDQTV